MNTYTPTKRAFAFAISMWIIASLLFATVIILRFAKDELTLSQGLNEKIQTQMMAQDIFELLKFYVPTADYTSISLKDTFLNGTIYNIPQEIIIDGREYNISKNISISLKDSSGLINIFYTPSSIIADTLTSSNILRNILQDSLDDWKDKDDVPHINGGEQQSYYLQNRDRLLKVRNSNLIQDIHELLLIKGFKKINFKLIQDNLFYGELGTINLALIQNPLYLGSLLKISYKESLNLLRLRRENISDFMKKVYTYSTFNDVYMGFSPQKQFIIIIKVKKGRAMSILKATIDFSFFDRPYIIISYKII